MEEEFLSIRNAEDAAALTGPKFDRFLSQLFELLGYQVSTVATPGASGTSLMLAKDGASILVWSKRYRSTITLEAIKDAHFAMSLSPVDEAWVVSTASATGQAQEVAERIGVRIIAGDDLTELIQKGGLPEKKAEAPKKATRASQPPANTGRLRKSYRLAPSQSHPGQTEAIQYQGAESVVTVPEGVVKLGRRAFAKKNEHESSEHLTEPYCQADRIVEVVLPEGLEEVEDSCFAECERLRKVTFPNSLTRIGKNAFYKCAFEEVDLLPSVVYEPWCYSMNQKLEEVHVLPGVTSIPTCCFQGCKNLKTVQLPASLRTIDSSAFGACKSLVKIEIPEGVEEINSLAFVQCSSLREVYLPNSLKRIHVSAFSGCPVLGDSSIVDVFDLTGVELLGYDGVMNESDARLDREYEVWVDKYCEEHHTSRKPLFWYIDGEIDTLSKMKKQLGIVRPTAEELEAQITSLFEASNEAVEEHKEEYRARLELLYSQLLSLPSKEKSKLYSLSNSIKKQENALSKALKAEYKKLFEQIATIREPKEEPYEEIAEFNARLARLRGMLREMGARDEVIERKLRKNGLV